MEGSNGVTLFPDFDIPFQSTLPNEKRARLATPAVQFMEFQSTPSAWRTTLLSDVVGKALHISIHVLQTESDVTVHVEEVCPDRISIHALRMEGDAGYHRA